MNKASKIAQMKRIEAQKSLKMRIFVILTKDDEGERESQKLTNGGGGSGK